MKIRMPPGRPRERKEKKVRVLTVYVSEEMHRWVRVQAGIRGITMTRFVSQVLQREMDKDGDSMTRFVSQILQREGKDSGSRK